MLLLIAGLCLVFLLYENVSELKGFVLTYRHTLSEGGNVQLNVYIFFFLLLLLLFFVNNVVPDNIYTPLLVVN